MLRDGGGRVVGARLRSRGRPGEVRAGPGDRRRRPPLARRAGGGGAGHRPAGRHACATRYVYVAGLEDRGYRWHFGRGVAAGAIPTNDGLHAVFVGMPPARFRERRAARRPRR